MQQLVEKYKPRTLAEFAGVSAPVAVLSHFAADPYESAWLLIGPPGTGKTTMALAVASTLKGEVHHIPSRRCDLEAVDAVCNACYYCPWEGEWHVVIVDEADRMSQPAQLAFLSKLDTTAAPPKTIFIFTANETNLLEARFLSRCRRLEFTTEGLVEPAVALLGRVWQAEAPAAAPVPDFAGLLRVSGMNVRDALMRLELEIVSPGINKIPEPGSEPPAPIAAVRPNHRRAAAPPTAGAFHCPTCSAPSANRQGVVAHLRIVHGLAKPERDQLMAAAAVA